MKKNSGQNTVEYLIVFGGVTIFFIVFLAGSPSFKKSGANFIVEWNKSTFQRILEGLLRQPTDLVTKQIVDNTNLDSYGAQSPPMTPRKPVLNTGGLPPGSYPYCSDGCNTAGMPPGQGYRIGQCYTGYRGPYAKWNPPPVCTQQADRCVCDITKPDVGIFACCMEVNDPSNAFINNLSILPVCPTPARPDTCSSIEPDNPAANGSTFCYPGMKYTCHEVVCLAADPGSMPGAYYSEFEKSCDNEGFQDTCPGGDAGYKYTCKPTDDFGACEDFYTVTTNAQPVLELGETYGAPGPAQYTFYYGRYGTGDFSPSGWTPPVYKRSISCRTILNN